VTYAFDADGRYHVVPLGPLGTGWRYATPEEVLAAGRSQPGTVEYTVTLAAITAASDGRLGPQGAYDLAVDVAARRPFVLSPDVFCALNDAARGVKQPDRYRWPGLSKRPLRGPSAVPVLAELERMARHTVDLLASRGGIAAGAYIMWRLTWLHAFGDGNGRTSRAAGYAAMLAGDPALPSVPERIERDRPAYLALMNAAHDAAIDGAGYRDTVDLAELERYLEHHASYS
jgi:hypothetical protein